MEADDRTGAGSPAAPNDPTRVDQDLTKRLLATIDRGAAAPLRDDEFDELARDVFRHQFDNNPLYRAYCERRGQTPSDVRGWLDVPSVPTDAFKAAPLVSGGDPAKAVVVFRTSGTTAGASRRGAHYLIDTQLYRSSLLAGFRRHLLPEAQPMPILSLVPDFADEADSSLSFMISEVVAAFGIEGSGWFMSRSGLEVERLQERLRRTASEDLPVLLAGTSFAFVHLLDALEVAGVELRLPPGSRVMDTGGFKGRSREVSRVQLYEQIEARLGVSRSHLVNEYGMTEMCSQFYDGIAGESPPLDRPRLHVGPGWVRSVAVDPETLRALPAGEVGVLRHFDVANLHSVSAIQTSDLGIVTDGGIELLGRVAGAEPRGCSIAMEELLDVLEGRPNGRAE